MRLAVTRSSSQLKSLSERAAPRGVEVVPVPVMQVRHLPFQWPLPGLAEDPDWVMFTSANGVNSFFERLGELQLPLSHRTRIGVLGAKTGAELTRYNFAASFTATYTYGKLMFPEFVDNMAKPGQSVVFARAAVVNFDPKTLFIENNIDYHPVVTYESVQHPVPSDIVEPLTNEDYILFTAPSAVMSYENQFGKPKAKLIAIGTSTASAMNDLGWTGFVTMKRANVDNVLEYLEWN